MLSNVKIPCDKFDASINGTLRFMMACFVPVAIGPKVVQLAVVLVCCVRVLAPAWRFIKFDAKMGLLAAWLAVYLISIVANIPGSTNDRILAAINTWLIWFFSLLLFLCVQKCNEIDWRGIGRLAFFNLCFFTVLMVVSYLGHLNFTLPWDGKVLWKTDWDNGLSILRYTGCLGYSNAVVFLFLFATPLAAPYLAEKNSALLNTVFVLLAVVLVFSCGSRVALPIVAVTGGLFWLTTVSSFGSSEKARLAIAIVIVGSLIIGVVISWSDIAEVLNSLLHGRIDSNMTRFSIYEQSVQMTLSDSPLFGLGIKDLNESGGIPFGSHSTYIGIFYRTGFVGSVLFAAAFLACVREILKAGNCKLIDCAWLLSVAIFIVFEDVDGLNWVIPLFFTFLLFLGRCGIGRSLTASNTFEGQFNSVN